MHARDKHLQAMLENKHHRTAMGVVSIGCEFGRVGWSRKTALERSRGPFSMKGKQAPRGGTRNRRRPREVSRARGAECISYAYAGAKKVRVTATKLTLREGQGRLRRVSLRGVKGGGAPPSGGPGAGPRGRALSGGKVHSIGGGRGVSLISFCLFPGKEKRMSVYLHACILGVLPDVLLYLVQVRLDCAPFLVESLEPNAEC